MRPHVLACLLFVAACARAATASGSSAQEHAIDTVKSTASFSIEHIFVDRVVGTVPIVSGSVNLSPNALIPENVTATLDAAKIHTDDPDRDDALKSADYFDVKKFPTWSFVATKITPTGTASFGMDGALIMHGVTQPEHLDVTVSGDASHPFYHAIGHIDRHAFGMKGARLDPVIGNMADVTLDIVVK